MNAPVWAEAAYPILAEQAPSDEQWPAVVERARDVLVVAGAGAGKTTTLTARYLTLLSDGIDVRAIVAVTFTRRAAREMRGRIRREIARNLKEPALSEAERRRWESCHRQMDAARISTIHALCAEILAAHPAESAIEPGFVILQEGESLLLRAEAIDETIDRMGADPTFDAIFELLTVKALRKVLKTALERRLDVAEAWAEAAETHAVAALDALREGCRAWVTADETLNRVRALHAAMDYARTSSAARADALFAHLFTNAPLLHQFDEALAQERWIDAASSLTEYVTNVKQVGVNDNWGIHRPKSEVQNLKRSAELSLPFAPTLDPRTDVRLLAARPHLRRVLDHACTRYAEHKRARHALDHDDLEERALDLLRDDDAVRDLWNRRIAALLVDEYQDSNPRQVRLFELLAGRSGARFGVGDPRQSIYAFRGANPHTMQREVNRLGESGLVAPLTVTRRAHAALVEPINRLAATLFGDDDVATPALRTARAQPDEPIPAPWVELLLVKGTREAGANIGAATALANRLIRLHGRGVAWAKIAVLCRDRASILPYEDALENAGIPYESGASAGFRQRPEIRDVLNALVAITNPGDNLALFGLLRSPAMGLDDGEIVTLMSADAAPARLRTSRHPPPGALWSALTRGESPEARRAAAIVERLHARAGRLPVASLLQRFLDETGYLSALALAGQTRAQRNLAKLVDDALSSSIVDAGEYLADLERRRAIDVREEEAPADEVIAVRLMTVHAAKGLEFPVVVLGNASHAPPPGNEILRIDEEYGLLFGPDRGGARSSVLFDRAKSRAREVEEAESRRILYVAATRARDLIIVNGAYTKADGWLKHFAETFGLADGLTAADPSRDTPALIESTPLVSCTVLGADVAAERVPLPDPARDEAHTQPASLDARLVEPIPLASPREPTPAAIPHFAVERPAPRRIHDPLSGRLTHEALAAWRLPSQDGFAEWLRRRVRAARVDAGAAHTVERRVLTLLRRFEASALCAEIAASDDRQSELPIVYRSRDEGGTLTIENLDASDEPTPVAGRIDLLYRRGDGAWVIVDFKSEPVPTLAVLRREVIPAYEGQIRAYGHAVRALTGASPRLTLCFLDVAGAMLLHSVALETARET